MLKADVFVWPTVDCKSVNFRSVDTLSAKLHCHMDYFVYWSHANSTHLVYSSFACNFEFSSLVICILRSTKSRNFIILLFSNFIQQKRGEGGGTWPLWPPKFAAPEELVLICQCLIHQLQVLHQLYLFSVQNLKYQRVLHFLDQFSLRNLKDQL